MTTPAQLAHYVRTGNRPAYVRAWYRGLRVIGFTARNAHRMACIFWDSYQEIPA